MAEDECTEDLGWYHGRTDPRDTLHFGDKAFPPAEWRGKWNALSAQRAEGAWALREEADSWMQRMRFGERYTHTPPDLQWANWGNQQNCVRPIALVDGRWPCLYTVAVHDPICHSLALQAVDPTCYIKGKDILRFLTLDKDAEDIQAHTRGFSTQYLAVGDLVWVNSITPSYQLSTRPVEEAIQEAEWMAKTHSPPDGWWTAFRVKEYSCVEPAEQTHRRLARIARDGMSIEGEDGKRKFEVNN